MEACIAGANVFGGNRLLVVSNRGPFEYRTGAGGDLEAVPGQGGVATALRAAAQFQPTTWLSSPFTDQDRLLALRPSFPGSCQPHRFVSTDEAEYHLFYEGFSNQILWFLQHGLGPSPDACPAAASEAWRNGYVPVNRAFARAVIAEIDASQAWSVMFHDYHFYLAPRLVKEVRPDVHLQHFIHIPWPKPAAWCRVNDVTLTSICRGLLGNDSVVFQTAEDAENFVATCAEVVPDARVAPDGATVDLGSRSVRVWADPISVDPAELASLSRSPEFARYQRLLTPASGRKVIVRVDRLDPTKNVIAGLEAYRLLLRGGPILRGRVEFLAFLVPTRTSIPAYSEYRDRTMALANDINREFGAGDWRPITIAYENNRVKALAGLSLADVILVNPLADGMNLVAKEGPLVNSRNAVLVLSTRAGAYSELRGGAIGIDPTDVSATVGAITQALEMSADERAWRARKLRQAISSHDLRAWFRDLVAGNGVSGVAPVTLPAAATLAG